MGRRDRLVIVLLFTSIFFSACAVMTRQSYERQINRAYGYGYIEGAADTVKALESGKTPVNRFGSAANKAADKTNKELGGTKW